MILQKVLTRNEDFSLTTVFAIMKSKIVKLQDDIPVDCLGCWARSWGMRFQPVKCNIMQITRKQIKKITASYTLERMVLNNIEKIKSLGITITNDLKWNTHVSIISTTGPQDVT